jgi:hypothetical protein
MRVRQWLVAGLVAGVVTGLAAGKAHATEYTFSTYGLGTAAFGAGVTPPPGTYVSAATTFYQGKISGDINIGGVVFDAGAKVELLAGAVSGLYVHHETVLGGRLGLAVTVPVGHIDIEATASIGPLSGIRETSGAGLGDVVTRLQLGWQHRDFSHLLWVQAVAPTGRYDTGLNPIIGLNRPGIDSGWAFTWAHKASKLQFNGAVGFNFNFENDRTDYRSGNEVHVEWAVGYEVAKGLVVGVVGYDWRQVSGDSGAGALLGPFEGRVDAIGPGLSYTTLIDKMPLIVNVRHYEEYQSERRISGSLSIATVTLKF